MSIKLQRTNLLSEIETLKKGEIGQVICKGLAELVQVKPQFPIDYLSKWLTNVNDEKQKLQQFNDTFKQQDQHNQKLKEIQEQKNQQEQAKLLEIENQQKEEDDFLEQIKQHDNHVEYMKNLYPNKIQQMFNFTGVYIGHVQNSQSEDRMIKYFGFSENQQFMDQRTLPKDQGVTYSLFKEETVQNEEDDGQKQVQKQYIYVPNVVQEQKMYFFKIPKLGSYLAVKLQYNSFLNEDKFKDSVQTKISQINAKTELKSLMEEREQNYKKDISEVEPEQLDEINQTYLAQKEKDIESLESPIILPSVKQEYIIAMDTCGQDREIHQDDIDKILKNVKYFSQQWENKELEHWNGDIDNYLKYQEKINKETQQINERFLEQEDIFIKQNIGSIDKWIPYEKIYEYEQNAYRLEKIKKQLKSKEVLEWLQMLSQYYVVQFPELFKVILIFMGYKAEEIEQKNTKNLDWIKIRPLFENEDFVQKIVNLNHRGSKPEKVENHMKIQNFEKLIQNFNEQEINDYNLGLGRLYRWLFYTIKCRISDVLARRELKEESKQNKVKAEKAQIEWEQQKEQFVQKAQEGLADEEKPNFDKVAAEQEYLSLNPEITIPQEIESDIDGDFE